MKNALIRGFDKCVVAWWVAAAALVRRLGRRPPASGRAAHIVAIKLVGMGDAVLMLPALAALRARGARLTVITTRRCAQVFCAPGVADEVLTGGLAAMWRALRSATQVLDFEQHVYWSAALAALAPASARTFGFDLPSRRRNLAFDRRVAPGPGIRHMKEIFDDLARAAGAHPVPGLLPLPIRPEACSHGLRPRGYWLLAPGSGGTVTFRRLSASAWVEIAEGIPADLTVVLTGTRHETALLVEIERRTRRPVMVAMEWTLEQLAAAMADAAGVIATDSGPMHLAAAMGVRTIGIFGPDSPRRYGPYSPIGSSVTLDLPCSPCNNCWVYREARCTNPTPYQCVRELQPAQVLAASGGSLGKRAAAAVAGKGAHDDG